MTKAEAKTLLLQSIQDLEYVLLAIDGTDFDALKAAYAKALQDLDSTCAIPISELRD